MDAHGKPVCAKSAPFHGTMMKCSVAGGLRRFGGEIRRQYASKEALSVPSELLICALKPGPQLDLASVSKCCMRRLHP
jgi:hypothetical protein